MPVSPHHRQANIVLIRIPALRAGDRGALQQPGLRDDTGLMQNNLRLLQRRRLAVNHNQMAVQSVQQRADCHTIQIFPARLAAVIGKHDP